jgi:acyl transferase domain-containing protein
LDVAVVGMSGRFPGAPNVPEFWRLVRDGRDGTRTLTDADLDAAGVPDHERKDPRYVPVWSGIPGADLFDAGFFGYTPHDAALIDPQHRVFLECAWEALEDAGYDARRFPGDIAVYAGCGLNQYLLYHLLPHEDLVGSAGRLSVAVASDKDNLATRVSYKLDLTGPSLTVQTNCSSAMVALHHAVNSLLDYQCDAAVVGAVSIKNPVPRGYLYEPDGINSPDGRCRAFDADAGGYFLGDGAGVAVLRRRADAIDSGDRIYALVRGSAVNNDGAAKVSFVAPGRRGQVNVIRAALRAADVDPATIQYVEANGAGTLLGDAIELSALREAYGAAGRWAIGSVKPNIGNLDTASGMASFIKAVLAVHYGELPPSIHYQRPNPQADLDGPIRVNTVRRDWPQPSGPRRAAVSSFGVGGTNAHVILEQAPPVPPGDPAPPVALLTVSAATPQALTTASRRLAVHLERNPDEPLADVAYTTQLGRRALAYRAFAVAQSHGEAVAALAGTPAALARASAAEPVTGDRAVVYLFPAQCPPAPELYAHEPQFRAEFDRISETVRAELGTDPRADGAPPAAVTFAVEYALARTLAAWGATATASSGDGVGALVAAVLDGGLAEVAAVRAVLDPSSAPASGAGDAARAAHPEAVPLTVGTGTDAGLAVLGAAATYRDLLTALGRLWCLGVPLDWSAVHHGRRRRRVGLPTYPFERTRHWIEPGDYPVRPAAEASVTVAADRLATADFVAPRSAIEEGVAGVWRRRLGVARVGLHDSLLALGGDSLSAAQILAELSAAYHVDLQLRVFLESPTVAALAGVIDGQLREAQAIRAALASASQDAGAAGG